jgi:Amt family ammonium transporter
MWGGIATGIFGDIPADDMTRVGFIFVQVKWTVIIAAWAFVNLFALFAILKAMGQLRVNAEEEIEGLDHSEHGMSAYVTT